MNAKLPAPEPNKALQTEQAQPSAQGSEINLPQTLEPKELPRDVLAFQPDVVEIEHAPIAGGLRWTLYVVLAFLLTIVVWASLAKVERVVTARGALVTSESKLLVQPWSTGIVRTVHVKEGEVVNEGDVLITLDPTFAEADLKEVEQQLLALRSRYRRLDAESKNESYEPGEDEVQRDALIQLSLHQRRKSEYDAQLAQFDKTLAVTAAAIKTNKRQSKMLAERLNLVTEIESLHGKLLKNSNTSRVQFLEAKNSRFQVQTQLYSLKDELGELFSRQEREMAERDSFIAAWNKEVTEELSSVGIELSSLQQRVEKAVQLNELVVLKAPASGIVLELAERSVGSVAKEAEPLVTLIPVGSSLVADVEIPASDIGRIRVDDEAVIKLDAFPFQRHGTLEGVVNFISEDAFENDRQNAAAADGAGAYYRTRLRLGSHELEDVPESFRLIPGMKLTAEVKIGSRRIITYLIYPVIKALGESLREP